MNEKKVDGRVRRTKRLLREGLTELISQKSIKKITVRELSDLVEINRGTFYLHYKDIYDLVEQIENELFEEFEAIINKYTLEQVTAKPSAIFTDICRFLEDNRKICSALMGDNGDINFVIKLREFISARCFNDFSGYFKTDSHKNIYGYIYSFYESAAVGIIRYWLADTSPERRTPESVALIFETLLIKGINEFQQITADN